MIQMIEAKNYRCLRYIRQSLDRFDVLVGPNASGKTTFLDVIAFLGKLLSSGLDAAIAERTSDFLDMLWMRRGDSFELAVNVEIPAHIRKSLYTPYDSIRYEIRIYLDPDLGEVGIHEERAWLQQKAPIPPRQLTLPFPIEFEIPKTIFAPNPKPKRLRILSKAPGGNDNFYIETRQPGGGKVGWFPSIRLGPKKSALSNLPEDESKFPVATWLKRTLIEGVQQIALNSLFLRKPSPPNQGKGFRPDGSNLPWVVSILEQPAHKRRLADWIGHLQTALPEIESIRTVERPEDRHRYLMLRYRGGLEVPSWMASDGTLRLLALTIPAYLPDFQGICLIEEPENGIHPQAVETMYQSLSTVYDAQMLLATHSPVILSMAEVEKVLCFKKTASGATDIVRGSEHPALRNWKGAVNLGTLFAGGVLG